MVSVSAGSLAIGPVPQVSRTGARTTEAFAESPLMSTHNDALGSSRVQEHLEIHLFLLTESIKLENWQRG